MALKQTLNENKYPIFLIVVGVLIFAIFIAFTLGLPTPTDPQNNTPTPTDPQNNTTQTPTPLPVQLQAYENAISNGATINQTARFTLNNQYYYYNDTYHYKPNVSLYHEHTAATQNETRRLVERYYTPNNSYIRQNNNVKPTQTNTTLSNITIDTYTALRPYLEITPDDWERTTFNTYTLETSLQNDPLAPQDGTLTLNATIKNETLQKLKITIKPDNTDSRYGTETTITYTLSNYTEPDFYWKSETNN